MPVDPKQALPVTPGETASTSEGATSSQVRSVAVGDHDEAESADGTVGLDDFLVDRARPRNVATTVVAISIDDRERICDELDDINLASKHDRASIAKILSALRRARGSNDLAEAVDAAYGECLRLFERNAEREFSVDRIAEILRDKASA